MQFKGTRGLWELLTMENPKNYNNEDLNNYEKIILSMNSYRHNNNPSSKYVKSSTGHKYTAFIKPILEKKLCTVYGKIKAGNTNLNLTNEIVNILLEIREI